MQVLTLPIKYLFIALIYFYKFCISPLLPKVCRYYPTCSNYAILCIKEFGIIKGIKLSVKRILRCNPKNKCGFDPVPDNIKGDFKWLI